MATRSVSVTFDGNATGIRNALRATTEDVERLRASYERLGTTSKAIQTARGQLNLGMFGTQLGAEQTGQLATGETIRNVLKQTNAMTQYGNTIKTVSQLITKINGQDVFVTKSINFQGDAQKIASYGGMVGTATVRLQAIETARTEAYEVGTKRIIAAQQRQLAAGATLQQAELRRATAVYGLATNKVPSGGAITLPDGTVKAAGASISTAAAQTEFNAANKEYNAAKRAATVATTEEIKIINEVQAADARYVASATKASAALSRRTAGLDAATIAPAGIPYALTSQKAGGPLPQSVISRLGMLGLDTTSGASVAKAGAYETFQVQRDAVRQVNRLTGSFRDHQKVLNTVQLEYTDAGKIITRFGGNLSGLSNVLSQIGRDFQKVAEFALATTVIFGGLRKAIQEVTLINQIEKSIRQLSITANLSRREAVGLFQDIAQTAINTATPLQELVKATDDIALATRRANQSTAAWKAEIISLTQSVGILTNLAGIDTVKATDLLVATMKQLNLEASQLPAILNKVTAVAGGQSNAIADIVQGMGVMAEAAKQANLSIDQTIATVQTLSQVTSKTPAEVATSFKNLVGSIDSTGAIKKLNEYNIGLRDGGGNLRNILDIYKEISDKIEQGIIPADRVKELVKAIAGGPRRAPDAAALLSNINDIAKVTETSMGATNEALIANAKILDTTNAKLIQIQARLDKFAVTKFADVINQGAQTLLDVMDKLLDVLNMLPLDKITQIGLQLALVFAAVKVGSFAVRVFYGTILNTIIGLRDLAGALVVATGAQREFNVVQSTSGLLGKNGLPLMIPAKGGVGGLARSALPAVALGGAVAAGTAASGGNLGQVAGAGLQTLGLGLLLNPLTKTPWTVPLTALGAIALAAGTALQYFTSSANDAAKAQESSTEEVLNSINAYNTINKTVSDYQKEQDRLRTEISRLTSNTKRNADENLQLKNLQNEYAQATVDVILSTQNASTAFIDLSNTLNNSKYKYTATLIAAGQYSPASLNTIVTELATKILEKTNPSFVGPEGFVFPPAPTTSINLPATGQTVIPGGFGTVQGVVPSVQKLADIDLKNLNADGLKQLFEEDNIKKLQLTAENLKLIEEALYAAGESGSISTEQMAKYRAELDKVVVSVNAIAAAERIAAINKAYLQAAGAVRLISPDDVENGQKMADLYAQLVSLAPLLPGGKLVGTPYGPGPAPGKRPEEYIGEVNKAFLQPGTSMLISGLKLDKEEAINLVRDFAVETAKITDEAGIEKFAAAFYADAGIVVEGLSDIELAARQSAAELADLQEALDNLSKKAMTDFANKSAQLKAQLMGGDISKADFTKQFGQFKEIASGIQKITTQYGELAGTYGVDFTDALSSFEDGLSSIIGLQDAQGMSADQLIDRMFELATTYGLTGDQVLKLVDQMTILKASLDKIASIREILTKFKFDIDIDKVGARGLAAVVRAQAYADAAFKTSRFGEPVGPSAVLLGYANDIEAALGGVSTAGSKVSKIYSSGTGSKGVGTSKTGAAAKGPDVSTIDLPEAIANAMNRDALIAEAVRRARALQGKIPGAGAEARDDIVELLKGTQRILEVRGVKDDLLRKALEELADIEKKRLEFESKADVIRRIRVGAGSFAAFANVPLNSQTGVSAVSGGQGPITVNLNINGQLLTPAQFSELADKVGATIKSAIANG